MAHRTTASLSSVTLLLLLVAVSVQIASSATPASWTRLLAPLRGLPAITPRLPPAVMEQVARRLAAYDQQLGKARDALQKAGAGKLAHPPKVPARLSSPQQAEELYKKLKKYREYLEHAKDVLEKLAPPPPQRVV